MNKDWSVTNMEKAKKGLDVNRLGNTSPWEDDWKQDTVQYLTDWLGWHNASTNQMRW